MPRSLSRAPKRAKSAPETRRFPEPIVLALIEGKPPSSGPRHVIDRAAAESLLERVRRVREDLDAIQAALAELSAT